MSRPKISLIGGGQVGGNIALLSAQKELGDIVIVDIPEAENFMKGKALDISQLLPHDGYDAKLSGTSNFEDIKDSDVVVITAGFPRQPGMNREDLLQKNLDIMTNVANQVKKYSPEAFVIVVSNPLDAMVYAFHKISGFPKNKVVGMAGALDSARFRAFIAEATNLSSQDINCMVLGGHGDTMVPVSRLATIGGVPLSSLLSKEEIISLEHPKAVQSASFSQSGTFVATVSGYRVAKVWSIKTGQETYTFEDGSDINAVMMSPDENTLLISSQKGFVVDIQTKEVKSLVHKKDGYSYPVLMANFSNQGHIITASEDSTAKIWDSSGKELYILKHDNRVRSAFFSRSGKIAVTASTDKLAKIWDTQTGKQRYTLKGHQIRTHGLGHEGLSSAVFNPSATQVATISSLDGAVKVWHLDKLKED